MDMQSFALGQRPTVQKPGLDLRCPHEHDIQEVFLFSGRPDWLARSCPRPVASWTEIAAPSQDKIEAT